MKAILTGQIVAYLKAQGAITDVVSSRIYNKQISAYREMPAVAIQKVSQTSGEHHSGVVGIYSTLVRFYVFARTLAVVEQIKERVNAVLDGELLDIGDIQAAFSIVNDADYDEYELLEAEEYAGVLEYEVNWSYS